jgi:cytochrome c551/c552
MIAFISRLTARHFNQILLAGLMIVSWPATVLCQEAAKEEDFFKINKVRSPEGTLLEVGGLCTLPNGDLAVTTRRGDIFIVENPTSAKPFFRKFASGLHEVLGVAYKNGSLYVVQRGELTRLFDSNMDGKADVFETVYAWPISGNYHEYSFGPKLAPDGSFFVTLNLGFPAAWWHPESMVPWRGWTLHIFDDGRMEPWAAGMRSPCGISMIDGELFYTDNQGDWVASGSIMPVKKGAFMGHPASLVWTGMKNSPLTLTQQQIFSKINPRIEYGPDGEQVKPENKENEKFLTEFELKKNIPEMQLPAVWLPHGILGISTSEIVKVPKGVFGPFEEQLLVGDQGQSKISRVFMETVNGVLQGCAWDFRSGFQSGIVRLAWANDGSLFVGETNRGWGSAGDANDGLQRLTWNNRLPFEMRTVKAMPDGFEIEFTKPVDKKYAADLASYSIESFIYKYHGVYGSPPVNKQKCVVKGVKVAADGMKVRLIVSNLRQYYIHTITLEGIRDKENAYSLVHPTGYYTLNSIPEGAKLTMKEVSTINTAKAISAAGNKAATGTATYAQIKPMLVKYTCVACHNPDKKQVGPGFIDVAKRNYSVDKILQLIKNPQPQNWPGYATPMAPMPQVPAADARRIAAWINSLDDKK